MRNTSLFTLTLSTVLALSSGGALAAPALDAQVIFGGSGEQVGNGINVSAGNVYFSGSSSTGGGGTGDGILGRWDGALTSQSWSQALGGNHGTLNDVAVSGANVYAAGDERGPLTTDSVGGKENKGLTARTSTTGGAYAFRTQTPAAPGFYSRGASEFLNGIAVNGNDVYVTGVGESSQGGYGLVLGRVDGTTGAVLNTATYPTPFGHLSAGHDVTTLGTGVFVAGVRLTPLGGGAYDHDALIRGYDSSLGLQWSRETITGQFDSITTLGGNLFAAGFNGANGLVASYDAAGNLLWSQSYAAGMLHGIVGLGGALYAVGESGGDGLLLELNATNGAVISSQTFGGAGVDVFSEIALDAADGSLYAIGTTGTTGVGPNGKDIWIARFTTRDMTEPVPEPGTVALAVVGVTAFGVRRAARARA